MRRERLGLLAALGLAAVLRFFDLGSQGIVHYDDAAHLLEARFLRTVAAHDLLHRPTEVGGLPLFHAKPLHAGLIALAQTCAGPTVPVAAGLMALFGVALVAVAHALGARLVSARAGLVAAFIYAANPWAVGYARSMLPECDSVFFAWCGFLFHLRACGFGRESGAAGARGRFAALWPCLFYAASMLANYRWAGALVVLFLGVEWLVARDPKRGALRFAVLVGVLVAAALTTDFVYGNAFLGARLDAATRPRTYLEDLVANVRKFNELGWWSGLRDPLRFPYFVWMLGTAGFAIPLVVGALRTLRYLREASGWPRVGYRLLLRAAFAPPLVLLVSACGFPRCLSLAQPAWAVLGAVGVLGLGDLLAGWIGSRGARGWLLPAFRFGPAVVAIGTQLVSVPSHGWTRSGYEAAAAWLRSHGAGSCFATQPNAYKVYGIEAIGLPAREAVFEQWEARGFRYALVDNQAFTGAHGAGYELLSEHCAIVAEIPHPAGDWLSFRLESPEASIAATRARDAGARWIRPSRILIFDTASPRNR